MKITLIIRNMLLGVFILAGLMACSNSSSSGGDGLGSLTLGVTDAPVDEALAVVVEFTGVHLKGQNGDDPVTAIEFEQPKVIDLLDLQGPDYALLLEDFSLAAGDYQWIRLQVVSDYTPPTPGDIDGHGVGSYLERESDGGGTEKIPLRVPSGSQNGLKLVGGFRVDDFGKTRFTIDFDLRKAIYDPAGKDYFELRPALRMVETDAVGHISGFIDPLLLESDTGCLGAAPADLEGVAVYAFLAGQTVDDMQSTEGLGPLTTALVSYDGSAYQYAFGFLDAGEYILALSCDAELDDSDSDDDITFFPQVDQVFVEEGLTTQVDFN